MKKNHVILTLLSALTFLTSCEKSLEVAGAAEGNSLLTIYTRSDDAASEVSYPVMVYAMNADGQCVRRQQLVSADDRLALQLEAMTYQIYAIGGATDGDYAMPGVAEATATSVVALNADANHGDLMAGKNTVTLEDNESTTLALSLSRKVMHIERLVIKNVPATVDLVTVSFEPLYQSLLLNGEYSTATTQQRVSLTEQSDGTTWQTVADDIYMLPAADVATITIHFHTGDIVTSFAYTCPQPLQANKHIRISGTFTGDNELTLTGTISGDRWNGTTTINFTFNSDGSQTVDSSDEPAGGSDDEPSNPTGGQTEEGVEEGSAPEENTIYKECFVMSVGDDETGEYVIVTLLHKTEEAITGEGKTQEEVLEEISDALPSFDINGITGWKLPTYEEAKAFKANVANYVFKEELGQNGFTQISSDFYFYIHGTALKAFSGTATSISEITDYTYGQALRPVTTVKFKK